MGKLGLSAPRWFTKRRYKIMNVFLFFNPEGKLFIPSIIFNVNSHFTFIFVMKSCGYLSLNNDRLAKLQNSSRDSFN